MRCPGLRAMRLRVNFMSQLCGPSWKSSRSQPGVAQYLARRFRGLLLRCAALFCWFRPSSETEASCGPTGAGASTDEETWGGPDPTSPWHSSSSLSTLGGRVLLSVADAEERATSASTPLQQKSSKSPSVVHARGGAAGTSGTVDVSGAVSVS